MTGTPAAVRPEAPALRSGRAAGRAVCSASQDGVRDGDGVMAHHVDVGGGGAVRARECVGVQLAAQLQAGFAGNLFHETRIADVFQEKRAAALSSLTCLTKAASPAAEAWASVLMPCGASNVKPYSRAK